MKQIDFLMPCLCSVIDHKGRENVIRTSGTHSAVPSVLLFVFFILTPHFDVTCDLLLNKRAATWNLLIK